LSQLTKAYPPNISAVHQLELSIADGELLVLVGPSGCGKSTTLRLIAGLESPTRGAIHFDGRDVTSHPAARRRVGMVFQGENLFPHLNVRDNLAVGLRLRGTSAAVIRERLSATVDTLKLESLLDRWPQDLSGGEAQQVALGRVMAGQMPLVLLDEPLAHVDPAQRDELRDAIRTLHQQIHTTLIHVTHDQQEAMSLGRRIAVMCQGQIVQLGTPREIYETPANTFVASFIGTPPMNLLPAQVINGHLLLGDRPVDTPLAIPDGGLVVGIRPERLSVGQRARISWRGTVSAIEFWGAEQVVQLAHDRFRFTARLPAHDAIQVGDRLELGCQPDDVYLFAEDAAGEFRGTLAAPSLR
jgi:ABC-type sugar transport system ATPase subunit